jgi:hypothetical protein
VTRNNAGFAFDLLHLSRAIEAVLFSRVFRKKLSEPTLLYKVGEFFLRLENSADSMGTPCALLQGATSVVTAFSGYSFELLQKSNSP